MKRWTPWIIAVLVLGLLAAGALRTLSHRKQQQAELAAASARPAQATVELLPGDVALAQLRRLLQAHRLVTLWGPGGIGKSRPVRLIVASRLSR